VPKGFLGVALLAWALTLIGMGRACVGARPDAKML
jgi:hypothetical protein